MVLAIHLQHGLAGTDKRVRLLQAGHHATVKRCAQLRLAHSAARQGQFRLRAAHPRLRRGEAAFSGGQGGCRRGAVVEHRLLLSELSLLLLQIGAGDADVGLGLLQAQPVRFRIQARQDLTRMHPVADIHGDVGDAPAALETEFGTLLLTHLRHEAFAVLVSTTGDDFQFDRAWRIGDRRGVLAAA